ncbi:equilibrative nucleotide transporter 1-like [Carya illinoinensis]|uniref:Equilibrative nucleoside transporter n=1 Tax=Carya illinoinensis TaxID=32201 RepID=A0A8T1QJT8_CARIL|nr:equilibrative nucleotide transporter 1-like [Carya illinoinensis]KAG6654511.1 hypothetical protein CIPAW_05G150200 [Carya illinoinensis]
MSFTGKVTDGDSESILLLSSDAPATATNIATTTTATKDAFHLAYIIYFTLGCGYLLPWNAFITAVDYFSYLYSDASIDRIFAVAFKLVSLFSLLLIILYAHKSDAFVRINLGFGLSVLGLLVIPVMDVAYIKGQVGLYDSFYVTVGAVALCGLAHALVHGGVVGAAGELPEHYMQAVVAGSSFSGVLVSFLRIITKAIYSQDSNGLRSSANLYFAVSIVVMVICIGFHNVAHRLPVIKYYNELKVQAVNEEKEEKGPLTGLVWNATLWHVVGMVKWYGFGIFLIYIVTSSIFPGYITEDVHSQILKDWYSILLITGDIVFDLVGKSLTAVYLLENAKVAIWGYVIILLFFPLFLGCLHGPKFFRTEIPVTILTCLLGLTNGYLTSVLMILAPKVVQLQHSETAGIVMVLFLFVGMLIGTIVSWLWVL